MLKPLLSLLRAKEVFLLKVCVALKCVQLSPASWAMRTKRNNNYTFQSIYQTLFSFFTQAFCYVILNHTRLQARHSFTCTWSQFNSVIRNLSSPFIQWIQIFTLQIYSVQTWVWAKARIALCRADRVSLCSWKSAQPFTKKSLCLMCLPSDENICFFLS